MAEAEAAGAWAKAWAKLREMAAKISDDRDLTTEEAKELAVGMEKIVGLLAELDSQED